MTTDCLDTPTHSASGRLHDAILVIAVAVIIVIPAALGLGSLL